jgi:hypothetical protein
MPLAPYLLIGAVAGPFTNGKTIMNEPTLLCDRDLEQVTAGKDLVRGAGQMAGVAGNAGVQTGEVVAGTVSNVGSRVVGTRRAIVR